MYRPPGNDTILIKKIFDIIAEEYSGVCICGGEWNIRLQLSLDSTPETITIKKLLKLLNAGMMDIWRDPHPAEGQFTSYSYSQSVHSRIDYFFHVQ